MKLLLLVTLLFTHFFCKGQTKPNKKAEDSKEEVNNLTSKKYMTFKAYFDEKNVRQGYVQQ